MLCPITHLVRQAGRALVVGLALLVSGAVMADATRPKIGLVLSGGGARGAAHVGVLKLLEELGVPIDYIGGTSMGAIVGGLYASGMSPQEIEDAMREIDWDDVFDDQSSRPERSFRRKRDDDDYLVKQRMGFNSGSVQLPLGVIQGQKFDLALSRLTLHVDDIEDFDKLPIPFRCVATDLETGDAVVLGSGNLARAIRASMAVPGAFGPVERDGRLLVDGGIANNMPVDVVRAMGADVLIVIDISTPLLKREDIKSVIGVVEQLTGYLTNRTTAAQLALLQDDDVFLRPELGKHTSADFGSVTEIIAIGYASAETERARLAKLGAPGQAHESFIARQRHPLDEKPVIEFVRIENDSRIADEVIAARLDVEIGQPLDIAQVEASIADIYGLELFQNVRYDVVEENGKTGLLISAEQKRWGPNYLQLGLVLAEDFDGDSAWDIGASYLRTGINRRAGEIRLAGQIGERPVLFGELYQPLDYGQRYFIAPRVFYDERNVRQFDNGHQTAEFRVERYGASLAMGRIFADDLETRLGFRRYSGSIDPRIGPQGPETGFDNAEAFARVTYDTVDNRNFPSAGILASVEVLEAIEGLGAHTHLTQLISSAGIARSWGPYTTIVGGEFATSFGSAAPVQNRFRIGGFTDLSGFIQDELSGSEVALVRAIAYRRFVPSKLFPVYLGLSLEYGNVYEDQDEISFDPSNAMIAGSVFVGTDTVLGPVYVGYGHAERGNDSLYLFLGRIF